MRVAWHSGFAGEEWELNESAGESSSIVLWISQK